MAATSVSCHTPSGRSRTYSPSTVSRSERAAGAPTDRRLSWSSIAATTVATSPASRRLAGPRPCLEVVTHRLEVGVAAAAAELAGDQLAAPRRHRLDVGRVTERAAQPTPGHRRDPSSHPDQPGG